MSIQAITRVIPPILEEASSVTNRSDSISTTQDVVASATASVTNGSDSISTTQNVVESATSSNTQATSQKASRVRRCWDRMTAVFSCNTSRADVALSNNVSIKNVALIGSAVQNKTERLASDLVNLQDRVSLASGSDSISTTQDVVASATASVTNGSDSISTTQNVVESATSSNTQATSQKASRVRRCWDRMTAVFCCNTSRADLASDLVNLQDRVSLASGSDSISTTQDVVESATSSNTQATSQKASRVRRCWDRMTAVFCCNTSRADLASDLVNLQDRVSLVYHTQDVVASATASVTNGSDSISTTQDVVASATASVTNGSDSISTTQDVVASATASVTNGSDSISTTQDVVASATAMSSDTQATSKNVSRIRNLVNLLELVSLASGLKESNLHSQNTISQYVRLNPIECMTVSKAEQFADYILRISQSNIDSTMKTVYLTRLLTQFHYPEGFQIQMLKILR